MLNCWLIFFDIFVYLLLYFNGSLQGGKELGSGVPKEGPVVDFNGIRCILCYQLVASYFHVRNVTEVVDEPTKRLISNADMDQLQDTRQTGPYDNEID